MHICILGLNHNSASVDIREKFSFGEHLLAKAFADLKSKPWITEFVLFSTCNRSEVYFITDEEPQIVKQYISDWIFEFFNYQSTNKKQEQAKYLYFILDLEAVEHLASVASGLDSLVVGEAQILGQVKESYKLATAKQVAGNKMHTFFQNIFTIAKEVRTQTNIGKAPVSVASVAVNLAKKFFGNFSKKKILLIGAGETVDLVIKHLTQNAGDNIIIANRTLAKAKTLAKSINKECQVQTIELGAIGQHIADADLVISCTAADYYIIDFDTMQNLNQENHTYFMLDLAVPRDINPQIKQIDNIYLYCIDDLEKIIANNYRLRKEEATNAQNIVKTSSLQLYNKMLAQEQFEVTMKKYRQQIEEFKRETLNDASKQITNGTQPLEVIEKLAHQLANKIVYKPSIALENMMLEGNLEELNIASDILTKCVKLCHKCKQYNSCQSQ